MSNVSNVINWKTHNWWI